MKIRNQEMDTNRFFNILYLEKMLVKKYLTIEQFSDIGKITFKIFKCQSRETNS